MPTFHIALDLNMSAPGGQSYPLHYAQASRGACWGCCGLKLLTHCLLFRHFGLSGMGEEFSRFLPLAIRSELAFYISLLADCANQALLKCCGLRIGAFYTLMGSFC